MRIEGPSEPGAIGAPETLLRRSIEHGHAPLSGAHRTRELGGAVGAVVVDDEQVGIGDVAQGRDERTDVLAFVEGREHDDGSHGGWTLSAARPGPEDLGVERLVLVPTARDEEGWLRFIDEVPYTLEHAARIMGAGRMYTLRKIVLPLVASGMVVTFLFVFILNWAEFLLALTLTHPDVSTLPVLLNKFQSASEGRLYGPQAAIGTVITIPVVIMGMLIQKHLVKGFSFGMMRR